jgi:hypothetical protein
MVVTSNGNGAARPRIERGHSLAHRQLNKHQLAALAADVEDGLAIYQPTRQQLAHLFKVNAEYIRRAGKLTPDQRKALLGNRDRYHLAISHPPKLPLALPAPTVANGVGDAELQNLVRKVGVGRVLDAAIAVEAAQ